MTAATREPEDEELDPVRWNDRALFGTFRGLPWWAAVLGTFVLAIVGTYIDVSSTEKTVGWVFAITFFLGAVGAVVFVERRSMFGPVVQPPLVLALVVPLVVVLTQGFPSGGLAAIGLNLGKPLIDGFPAMAITTACTVILGIVRVTTQKDPNRPTKDEIREAKVEGRAAKRKPAPAEERPKRPRESAARDREPAPRDEDARPRRKPAPAGEDRPKRPRPQSGDRPRRPREAGEPGRPPQRRPRPRDES
ncbi:DUF6542 domain-containing protein [Actinosynnema sp. NPDC047251]|uniref:DUF6542 domain-containing protein n=1 Tax=Saccharothrix espanaensis (strain ATCC 51144 / DSM 44229 / JCM 9112 / NBRC 15066 / NRRL 15764) TaxID=1179773 RepID=K0JTK8_SACES|nr:DUF6542 domain-containing protein [Saccharothrix espanaensis]CCH28144.1 hypothetical protein BN6_08150 [Saccharothrix espanaensis DSM 44229]